MALTNNVSPSRFDLLSVVLEHAEAGIVVIEGEDNAIYVNASARKLLGLQGEGTVPEWMRTALAPLINRLWDSGTQAVDRWIHAGLVLRVRARPLDRVRGLTALEITVAHAGAGPNGQIAEPLATSLGLSMPDARLLAFLWRGMSNEEIAQTLGVRLGTVKSRLFRLYQKLGVTKRATAVLRAAEVLKELPADRTSN